jgi:dUTP pyrophosphatase
MKLLVKKLSPDVVLPSYGSDGAAGLDLCAYGEHWILPKERKLIPTGISVEWKPSYLDNQIEKPSEYYLRIAPRSGLAVKHSIDIGGGVIDADYRGEIKICFINNSNTDAYNIKHGDRIAQGILERIKRFDEIILVEELEQTVRGSGGFGSTGLGSTGLGSK